MSTIYPTGLTSDGGLLIGGVWRFWSQDGFPIELSYLQAKQRGWCIDWAEAMAEASITNDLPAIHEAMSQFLDEETMLGIKIRFAQLVNSGVGFSEFVEMKRKNQTHT
jgi:hypothetical protein